MTAICPAAIHLCALRATRLDSLGFPVGPPNNYVVSDRAVMITMTPVTEAGADKTIVSGCDCISATYRGTDKFKRWDLEVDMNKIDPAILEVLLGAPAILDGSDPIGNWWPSQVSCDDPQQPNVCLEGWMTLWEDDHAMAAPYKYLHYIWPSTSWTIGTETVQNEFVVDKVTGYNRGNPNWGTGPFGDLPEACQPQGGRFFTNDIPAASCGWSSASVT